MQILLRLYPISIERAFDAADQIKLDLRRTHIEPSRFSGFFFDVVNAAMMFRLTFDAKPWPTKCDDFFLYVERSPEVSAWIEACGYEYEIVEIVAILFDSDEDQKSFEDVIWLGK